MDGGINLYSYVSQNPVNAIDSMGLSGVTTYDSKYNFYMASGQFKKALDLAILMGMGAAAIQAAQNAIDSSPLDSDYENYLLDSYQPPGWPEDPKDWCPKLLKVIEDIAAQIAWRKGNIKYWDNRIGRAINRIARETHQVRIKRLEKLKKRLDSRYENFCKQNCP